MEIKIKYFTNIEKIKQIPNGDWVDLRSAIDVTLKRVSLLLFHSE